MEQELENWLETGEKRLWSARPDGWHFARPTFMLYLAGVPWTVFTFFWLDAVTGGFQRPGKVVYPYPAWTPWVAIGAGVILLAAGLWMLSAPFWIWRKGQRTLYVVTERRAAILVRGKPAKNEMLALTGDVVLRIRPAGKKFGDLEIICGKSQALLFRALRQPAEKVREISAARGLRLEKLP